VQFANDPELLHDLTHNPDTISLFNNSVLMVWCFIGSAAGAVLAVCIWHYLLPEPLRSKDKLLPRFGASAISGFIFSPMIIYYSGMDKTVDTIAPVAALTSFLSVAVIVEMLPAVIGWATKIIKGRAGIE
jgi:FtsH-binding integral membrane protein